MATIVLDPGHGGEQDLPGSSANRAQGPRGTLEKDLTLAVAGATRDTIGERHRVLLTRDVDANLAAADRAAVARDARADVFLSIHFNAHNDPGVQGIETLVRGTGAHTTAQVDPQSRALAQNVQSSLVDQLGLPDRGLKVGRWVVLNDGLHEPETARCIAEVSFLSNPDEEERLGDTTYVQRIGAVLAGAIETFLGGPVVSDNGAGATAIAGVAHRRPRHELNGGYDPDGYQSRRNAPLRYGYRVGEFGQVPEGYLFVEPADMVRGIDVSHYQGNVDWARVAAAGVRFAYIKATEGTTMQDARFADNWREAQANEIARGAYHLLTPRSMSNVDTQARNFLDSVTLEAGDMPPVLDVEARHLRTIIDEEGEAGATDFIYRWCELVKQATRYQPILYMSTRGANFLNFTFGALPSLELWLPRYRAVRRPPPLPLDRAGYLVWPHWSIWQHSSDGIVDGIGGRVDLNLFNGNEPEFQRWIDNVQPGAAAAAHGLSASAEEEGEGDELDLDEPIAVIQQAPAVPETTALDLGPENPADTAGTAHFNLGEFRCRDGTDCPPRFRGNLQMLMENLEVLRTELSHSPIRISSGYRTPSYNRRIGGASTSRHMVGLAADMQVDGHTARQVFDTIQRLQDEGRMRAGGLHAYEYTDDARCNFVHYDVRGRNARWPTRNRVCHRSAPSSAQARSLGIVQPDYHPSNPIDAIQNWIDFFQRYQRWRVGVPDTGYFPHSAICKLQMAWADGSTYGGTAFYIAPDRLLTAAHNLVDTSDGTSATSLTVTPGLNGTTEPFGHFTVSGSSNWKVHPNYDGSFRHDLALIRVSTPPPSGQYFDVLEELTQSRPGNVIVCGYSADTVSPTLQHLDGDHIRWISNDDEVYGYNLQTEAGASGSPVFYLWGYEDPDRQMSVQTIPIVGVHVARPTSGEPTLNRACRLTEAKVTWIQQNLRNW